MKKENKNSEEKEVKDDKLKEPTQADGISIKEPLTKKQKFKNLFKHTEESYALLKYLFYSLMFVLFMTLFLISTLPVNLPTIMLMVSISMPFNSKYYKTGAWKALYVIVPSFIAGGVLNLYIFGVNSVIFNISYTVAILGLSMVLQLLIALFSKDKKAKLHNSLVYFLSALFWVGYLAFLIVF